MFFPPKQRASTRRFLVPTIDLRRRGRSAIAITAIFVLSVFSASPAAADSTAQTIPFTQDWSNTGLITSDDNWTAVPGIVGFLGNNLTATTDIDPQTVLVGGDAVDVIANQTDPSLSQGGVAEFEIGNPVVALQGTTTADAPNVVITLNTVGLSNVHVSFVLRDLDGTTDNAVQQVAVQYRVGATGTYTNLPAGYVADATSGPSLAILATPVAVGLPATADDRPIVNVRIITTNAGGNDEWVGIDDIAVVADLPPAVQSTSPASGATDVARDADLAVTFDEPVDVTGGWFDITCGTSQGHTATVSGGPQTFTLDPDSDFAYGESCTFTVYAQNVTDQDTNDPPNLMVADHVATFQTVAAPPDQAPAVESTSPADGAIDVAPDANLSVTFDEPVNVSGAWFDITCATSNGHSATVSGGPLTFDLDPDTDFAYDESCTFTVNAAGVADQDTNDPPDTMTTGHVATFQTVPKPPDPPKPPTVDAGGPYDVVAGGSVEVTATGSQPDGQTLTYRWDLDNDGTFETPGQTATFSAAGLTGPVTRTIAVEATAPTGLTATDEATVNVSAAPQGFDFGGFRGYAELPMVNDTNLGTQFVRFSLGGDYGLDIFEDGHPTSAPYDCGSTPPSDASEPAEQQGANGFKYDPGTDEYTFKWNVDNSWKNTCRVFVLGLSDGSTHNLAFHFGSSQSLIVGKRGSGAPVQR
jgi:Bacterial Ig-like domain